MVFCLHRFLQECAVSSHEINFGSLSQLNFTLGKAVAAGTTQNMNKNIDCFWRLLSGAVIAVTFSSLLVGVHLFDMANKDELFASPQQSNQIARDMTPANLPNSSRVGVFVASDSQFQKEQEPLMRNLKNYAHRHDYDFFLVDPADEPTCRLSSFPFNKH